MSGVGMACTPSCLRQTAAIPRSAAFFALSPRGWQLMAEPPDLEEVHGRLSRT